MASDKMRALISFAKLAVSAVAGFGIYFLWVENRTGETFPILGEWYLPYVAGIIVTAMVYLLLTKLNKGGD